MGKLEKGIIVSCQAEGVSAFNNVDSIVAFAKEAERGGAVAVRIEGIANIEAVKAAIKIPIIGIIKKLYSTGKVWITPYAQAAKMIEYAGADYIAADATGRKDAIHSKSGWEYLEEICSESNIPVIGDMAYVGFMNKNIDMAEKCGCKMLSTTLSGYTEYCKPQTEPDFKLLKDLINNTNLPIIAEGRYYEQRHVELAKHLGANNIVIGSAITRPHLITKRFTENYSGI